MPGFLVPLIAGAAAAGGGILSWLGGKQNDNTIRDSWRQEERMTRESWQREDTAVQRRVQDLRAAGINPLMAAGQAASSGGGGSYSGGSPYDYSRVMPSAVQAMMIPLQIEQMKANVAETKARTQQIGVDITRQNMETGMVTPAGKVALEMDNLASNIAARQISNEDAWNQLQSNISDNIYGVKNDLESAKLDLTTQQKDTMVKELDRIAANIDQIKGSTRLDAARVKQVEAQIEEFNRNVEYWKSGNLPTSGSGVEGIPGKAAVGLLQVIKYFDESLSRIFGRGSGESEGRSSAPRTPTVEYDERGNPFVPSRGAPRGTVRR